MVVMETEKPTATMALGRPRRQHRLWGGKQAPWARSWGRGAEDPAPTRARASGSQVWGPPPGSEVN